MRPILWSFRRCPYAIRARLAIRVSGAPVTLREVVLRAKPEAFLAASPSATVPCLVLPDEVIDESLDIMRWALARSDPRGWLDMPPEGENWIARNDGPFKQALDRCKYANRFAAADRAPARAAACAFVADLDAAIARSGGWIFGHETLADAALFPFLRQFAFIDKGWFDAQPWPAAQDWLARHLAAPDFAAVMGKLPQWEPGQADVVFP